MVHLHISADTMKHYRYVNAERLRRLHGRLVVRAACNRTLDINTQQSNGERYQSENGGAVPKRLWIWSRV